MACRREPSGEPLERQEEQDAAQDTVLRHVGHVGETTAQLRHA
jgi:hypothetical protein